MAEYLTPEKLNNYIQLFAQFDYDGKGSVHYTSLLEIFNSMHLNLSENELIKLLQEAGNKDPSRVIITQFLAIISITIEDTYVEEEVHGLFRIFDLDNNKVIDEKDIDKTLQDIDLQMGENQIKEVLFSAKKKELTYQDFRHLLLDR